MTQKHCTESKTRLGAPGAPPEPRLHSPAMSTTPRLRAHCTVSQASPGHVASLGGRIVVSTRAPARSLRRIAALPPNVSCLYRETTQRPSRVPVTIRQFVSQHSPSATRPSRAPRLPLREQAVSWPLLWPYRRPCCTPARPCGGPQAVPRPASQPLCHDTTVVS